MQLHPPLGNTLVLGIFHPKTGFQDVLGRQKNWSIKGSFLSHIFRHMSPLPRGQGVHTYFHWFIGISIAPGFGAGNKNWSTSIFGHKTRTFRGQIIWRTLSKKTPVFHEFCPFLGGTWSTPWGSPILNPPAFWTCPQWYPPPLGETKKP